LKGDPGVYLKQSMAAWRVVSVRAAKVDDPPSL
jgi:hypothetical protein